MASGPTTSRQIDGEKVETMTDFIFLGSKITTDADCSHEIRRHLLLERKVTNLDSVLKTSSSCSQSYDFSCSHVQMLKLDCKEDWAPKNWCFWTAVLEKTLESHMSKSILKEISSEYSLEGLMLKLKLQYFGHLMQRADSLEKTLMLGKMEGKRRRSGREWNG